LAAMLKIDLAELILSEASSKKFILLYCLPSS